MSKTLWRRWTIFGAGNFLADIIDAIEANGDSVAYIVLNQEVSVDVSSDIQILSLKKWKAHPASRETDCYIFGFIDPNKEKFLRTLEVYNIVYTNIIHPRAYISNGAKLGHGNYIGPGSVVGPKVVMGNYNYLNRNSSIGHHTTIGDFNHVGPGATICGRCEIGSRNYFGAGSNVRDGIKIPHNVKIGVGAAVVKDTGSGGVYIGVPAKNKG